MNLENMKNKEKWISSKEAMKELKIKSCDLMHMRESGKLKFHKKGNAYFYEIERNIEED